MIRVHAGKSPGVHYVSVSGDLVQVPVPDALQAEIFVEATKKEPYVVESNNTKIAVVSNAGSNRFLISGAGVGSTSVRIMPESGSIQPAVVKTNVFNRRELGRTTLRLENAFALRNYDSPDTFVFTRPIRIVHPGDMVADVINEVAKQGYIDHLFISAHHLAGSLSLGFDRVADGEGGKFAPLAGKVGTIWLAACAIAGVTSKSKTLDTEIAKHANCHVVSAGLALEEFHRVTPDEVEAFTECAPHVRLPGDAPSITETLFFLQRALHKFHITRIGPLTL